MKCQICKRTLGLNAANPKMTECPGCGNVCEDTRQVKVTVKAEPEEEKAVEVKKVPKSQKERKPNKAKKGKSK